MDMPSRSAPGAPAANAALSASERALATLKPFRQIAEEECQQPLHESAGPAAVRWEIYSTWTLLLCFYHAEAEAERCRASWTPRPWETEAQALRQLYLESRSLRVLTGVLRWFRWAHAGPAGKAQDETEDGIGDGSFERTRRALQLQSPLPAPLQAGADLHPDGPLQRPGLFDAADLEDEERLLKHVLRALRRGDLRGAMKTCAEGNAAWRTT